MSAAKFSRQHYQVLAEAIRSARKDAESAPGVIPESWRVPMEFVEKRIARYLAADNCRFNKAHFIAVAHGEKELASRPARSRADKWAEEHSPECVRINEKRGPYECICEEGSVIRVKDLQNQIGQAEPRAILYCPTCGSEASAHRGDYWQLAEDEILTCECGENFSQVIKSTVYSPAEVRQ